jgi:hypothetical protein
LENRNSHGLEQFCGTLHERPGMTILDLAGANQHTISYITNLGHRVYSDDFMMQLDRFFGDGDFYENQTSHHRVVQFLEHSLDFPENNFDGVLLWDSLEFLEPSLLDTVMRHLLRTVRPGSCLFALFHSQDKSGPVPSYSYRIQDAKTILMNPRGARQPAQTFNNRALEKLFQDFASVKFFLTRDHLREVIVWR